MSQSNIFITIGKSFEELKRAAQSIAEERGVAKEAQGIINEILRDIDKAQIIEHSKQSYEKTGKKLPKDLKKQLSRKFCYSEKMIELLVYENIKYHKQE